MNMTDETRPIHTVPPLCNLEGEEFPIPCNPDIEQVTCEMCLIRYIEQLTYHMGMEHMMKIIKKDS